LASMTEAETLRLLLQNKFDRIENLVQMNHTATLAVPSVLATIWGIEGGLDNFRNAWILAIISIGLLLIWRYFAHYLNDDIAKIYIEAVNIENLLHVPIRISLFSNLIETFQDKLCSGSDPEGLFQFIKNLAPGKRILFLNRLLDDKKMGARGHDLWDNLATLLSGIFFLVIITTFGVFPLLIAIIVGIVFILIMNPANYQRDPTIFDLKEVKKNDGIADKRELI
jgi:hypothetical protein